MILIKLGGSVITDKNKPLTARLDVIQRLANEIAACEEKVMIIHGGGSFGHIKAAEYCIQEGLNGRLEQRQAISDIQIDMRKLNSLVVDAFHEARMPVASIPAGAIAIYENGEIAEFPVDVLSHYLDIGVTPITFGDVVVDKKKGVCICSGDDIMLHLARELKVEKCFFVTEVDGLYASYPPADGEPPIEEICKDTEIEFMKTSIDVTGGMARKLELMLEIAGNGCQVHVINGLVPDRLKDAITGKDYIGTVVKASSERKEVFE